MRTSPIKANKWLRYALYVLATATVLCLSLIVAANMIVVNYAKDRLYDKESLETAPDSLYKKDFGAGLLLGTTPQTRLTAKQNYFFKYRIDATEELYKAGVINIILISGDENSLDGVNEVEAMRDSLIVRGIPKDHIYLDGKGFRTLDAVVRARKIYSVRRFIIISQQFHNERAIYLADHLGLDVEDIAGYNAVSPKSALSLMTYIREAFARVKVFLDIWMDKQPKELGEEDPIMGHFFEDNFMEMMQANNTVYGHNECDTIIGNFTGKGIDTLYVYDKYCGCDFSDSLCWDIHEKVHNDRRSTYFLKSTNRKIPSLELYGCDEIQPKIVNEGDLDGNGTCEVGYLHTWLNSQWRYYRVFTLVNGQWRYLIYDDKQETPGWFRMSGVDIVQPGPQKGTVKINYAYEGYDEVKQERVAEIRDTIVFPTFDVIKD